MSHTETATQRRRVSVSRYSRCFSNMHSLAPAYLSIGDSRLILITNHLGLAESGTKQTISTVDVPWWPTIDQLSLSPLPMWAPPTIHNNDVAIRARATQIHGLDMGQQNSNFASLLVPIHRLPVEMLSEIFLFTIYCHAHSPSGLMCVCRSWRAVILATPNIWANVRLSSWTELDKVRFLLKRTRASLLNVEIDTVADDYKVASGSGMIKLSGLAVAAMEAKRWRNLTITSFPPKMDIDAYLAPETPTFTFDGPMNALESFRIKNPCESGVVFDQLLDIVGRSSHSKLIDMELMSSNTLHHFSQPQFASIFRRLIIFKVGVRDIRFETGILPYFERLETLEACGLRLPFYPPDTDLPVVRTLRHIKLKAVSIQWMVGREFPMVVECAITWPRQIEAFRDGTSLPACTSFTYEGRKPYLLSYANLPQLTSLAVGNSMWNPRRGSQELIVPWAEPTESFARQWDRLKTLHFDSLCRSETIITILRSLPALEELMLTITRPNALGKKFFTALIASTPESSDSTGWSASLCPNLQTLGLRYRRWIRASETDNITSLLPCIVDSRKRTSTPLRSLRIWMSMDEVGGTEMCEDGRRGFEPNGAPSNTVEIQATI